MITELSIRDRFLKCLDEVKATEKAVAIAAAIGCTPEYLSGLPKNNRPAIPSAVVANFCLKYNYNPAYLIAGRGKRKIASTTEEDYDRWETERNKYLDLIGKLINELLDTEQPFEEPSILKEILKNSGKYPKKN